MWITLLVLIAAAEGVVIAWLVQERLALLDACDYTKRQTEAARDPLPVLSASPFRHRSCVTGKPDGWVKLTSLRSNTVRGGEED